MSFDTQKYLKRISWHKPPLANLETLRGLHEAHLLQVPFENLDIHWGQTIALDRDKLFEKVVEKGRGGFCYELNGLFYELLDDLGYRVDRLSARVYEESRQDFGPPHDHLALMVHLNGKKWLADVGFGDFIRYPLQILANQEQEDLRGPYRLIQKGKEQVWEVQSRRDKGGWLPEYRFEEIPRQMQEFAEMCQYHQSDPRSTFLKKKVCTLARERGRYTLSSTKMRIHRDGKALEEWPVESEEHFEQLLEKYFHMKKPRVQRTT